MGEVGARRGQVRLRNTFKLNSSLKKEFHAMGIGLVLVGGHRGRSHRSDLVALVDGQGRVRVSETNQTPLQWTRGVVFGRICL